VNLKAHSIDNQIAIDEKSRFEDLLDVLSVICNVYVHMFMVKLLKHSSDTSALFFSSPPHLLRFAHQGFISPIWGVITTQCFVNSLGYYVELFAHG